MAERNTRLTLADEMLPQGVPVQPTAPQLPDAPPDMPVEEKTSRWMQFLGQPKVQAALLQYGVSALMRAGSGRGTLHNVGGAIGDAAGAVGRVGAQEAAAEQQRIKEERALRGEEREDTRLDILQQNAESNRLRAEKAGQRGTGTGKKKDRFKFWFDAFSADRELLGDETTSVDIAAKANFFVSGEDQGLDPQELENVWKGAIAKGVSPYAALPKYIEYKRGGGALSAATGDTSGGGESEDTEGEPVPEDDVQLPPPEPDRPESQTFKSGVSTKRVMAKLKRQPAAGPMITIASSAIGSGWVPTEEELQQMETELGVAGPQVVEKIRLILAQNAGR